MTDITNTHTIRQQNANRGWGLLNWLQHLDAAYRQSQQLKKATPEQLNDMGISRKQADTAFLGQFRDDRWTPRG